MNSHLMVGHRVQITAICILQGIVLQQNIDISKVPEGCLLCNTEEVSKFIIQHGADPTCLSPLIPDVLKDGQELVEPCLS